MSGGSMKKDETGLLSKVFIFSSLSEEELLMILDEMETKILPKGSILFREGDPGKEMFLILSGTIVVSVRTPDGGDVAIAELSTGEFLGEMSIIEDAPRSATATAREETVLKILKGTTFSRFLTDSPVTASAIMERMLVSTCGRLHNTGAFLSDMVRWGENARQRAVTDEFTGLYNRRFLDDALAERFADALINRKSLSLVMVDLDRFGTLNSLYGQETGDNVILAAVPVFRKVFREADILSRYGGDEFTFILPETGPDEAELLCSNLVSELRTISILRELDGPIKDVTGSVGIASFPAHGETLELLKERADKALYMAKEKGRNCACLWKEME